jgi:hypothetical protein
VFSPHDDRAMITQGIEKFKPFDQRSIKEADTATVSLHSFLEKSKIMRKGSGWYNHGIRTKRTACGF